jgi:hypothetical protein
VEIGGRMRQELRMRAHGFLLLLGSSRWKEIQTLRRSLSHDELLLALTVI